MTSTAYNRVPDMLIDVPIVEPRQNLLAFATEHAEPGDWAEFGVHTGNSARMLLDALPMTARLHLYDSYLGLPEIWVRGDGNRPKGRFKCARPKFADERVVFHDGWFAKTLAGGGGPYALVHIDCDIYSSALTVLEADIFAPGAVVIFDEIFGYPGYEAHEYKAAADSGRRFEWLARDDECRAVGRLI